MERKERRLYDYFNAEDIRRRGRVRQQQIREDPSRREEISKIAEEGMVGAVYEVGAMIISLARLSLLAPAARLIQRGLKKRHESAPQAPK